MGSPRLRWFLGVLLLGFVALNVVAFFHAWRFTHFTTEAGPHSANLEQLSAGQKIQVLLTGNPKPQNGPKPGFPVETVTIDSPNGPLEAWYAS